MGKGSRPRSKPSGPGLDSRELEFEALLELRDKHPNLDRKELIALHKRQKVDHSKNSGTASQRTRESSSLVDGVGESGLSSAPSSFSDSQISPYGVQTSSHQLNAFISQSLDQDAFSLIPGFSFDTTSAPFSGTESQGCADANAKIDTTRLYSGPLSRTQPIPINSQVSRRFQSHADESLPSLSLSSSIDSHATAMSRQVSGASFITGGLELFRMESNDGRDAAKSYGLEGFTDDNSTFMNCEIVDLARPRRVIDVPQLEVSKSTTTEPAGNAPLASPKRKFDDYASWGGDNKSTDRRHESEQPTRERREPPLGPPRPPRQLSSRRSRYVRPVHPRIYCDKCPHNTVGFRGEHEFRRHYDRVHATVKRYWIVIDRSKDGKFFSESKCKACKNGKKYGMDYNATAHLKRQHFDPKKHPKVKTPENLREWIQMIEEKHNGEEVISTSKKEEDDMKNGNNGQEEAASMSRVQSGVEDPFFDAEYFEASLQPEFREAMARSVDALQHQQSLWYSQDGLPGFDPSVSLQFDADVDQALRLTSQAAVTDDELTTYYCTHSASASYSSGASIFFEDALPTTLSEYNTQLHQRGHLHPQLGSFSGAVAAAVNDEFVNLAEVSYDPYVATTSVIGR